MVHITPIVVSTTLTGIASTMRIPRVTTTTMLGMGLTIPIGMGLTILFAMPTTALTPIIYATQIPHTQVEQAEQAERLPQR
jgi:hypothetical protein